MRLGGASDDRIWQYATDHGFAIVSKDSDFAERSALRPRSQVDKARQLDSELLSSRLFAVLGRNLR